MGCASSTAAPQLRCKSGLAFRFPMWVLPADMMDVLDSQLPAHEALKAKGMIVKLVSDDDSVVIFISHQWLGSRHPDPQGEQFAVLRNAFHMLRDNMLKVRVDHFTDQIGMAKHMVLPTSEQLAGATTWRIWYDYFSCPQDPSDVEALRAAVSSIPAYIDRCSFFVILVPPLRHERGMKASYHTWCQRGWCRVEYAACLLSVVPKTALKLQVSHSMRTTPLNANWMMMWPGSGEFTYDSDRAAVGEVMKILLKQKQDHYLSMGDLGRYRFLVSMESKALKNLSNESMAIAADRGLNGFLETYKIPLDEVTSSNYDLTPLMVAAMDDNAEVFRTLMSMRCDVRKTIHKRFSQDITLGTCAGLDCMALAAFLGSESVTQELLLNGFSANHTVLAVKAPVFGLAVAAGHVAICDVLLANRANIHAVDLAGQGHIDNAVKMSNVGVLKFLLENRGDPLAQDIFGSTPLSQACACGSNPEVVRLLVEHRADVNQIGSARGPGKLMRWLCQQDSKKEIKRKDLQMMTALAACPPIFRSIWHGDTLMMQTLLELRASLEVRDFLGRTPLTFAKECGLPEVRVSVPSSSLGHWGSDKRGIEQCTKQSPNKTDTHGSDKQDASTVDFEEGFMAI